MPQNDLSLPPHPERRSRARYVPLLAAVVLVGVIAAGLLVRHGARAELERESRAASVITVATMKPARSSNEEDLVLPGSTEGLSEASIYARGQGYVKRVLVDIGSTVQAGQVLAELDTPELDEELRQAQAQHATTRATWTMANSTAERWRKLSEQHLVAQQDADVKMSEAFALRASLDAAAANVNRLRRLDEFRRIAAPFAGTITERNIDVGQLVDSAGAGSESSGASGRPLFRLTSAKQLRIYVQVPQSAAARITAGTPAALSFPERPGKTYDAKVVRTSNAIDRTSRSLSVELAADNAAGELLPGAYVEIGFKLPSEPGKLRLPVASLIFRGGGPMAATLDDQGKIALKKIVIGRDFGTEFEVTSGVGENDRIVLNPPDSLVDGQPAREARKAE